MNTLLWLLSHYSLFSLVVCVYVSVDGFFKYWVDGSWEAFRYGVYLLAVPILGVIIDHNDLNDYLFMAGPLLVGTTARFGSLLQKKLLTWRIVIIHFLAAIPLCIVTLWAYKALDSDWNFPLLVTAVSYFSMSLIPMADESGPAMLKMLLYRFTGWWSEKLKPNDDA